jgi:hypothetical protein
MSRKKNKGIPAPKLPPIPDAEPEQPKSLVPGIDLMTFRVPRIDFKAQEDTIRDMFEEGFEHYETFYITNSELAMRFRKIRKGIENGAA